MAPKNTTREEPLGEPRAPIYPLSVTSVVEKEDGSLEVNCSGSFATAHLQDEDAHAFKLHTSTPYQLRYQQEQQQAGGKRALDLFRQGALA